jgi:serine/threonine-protein kinase
MLYELLAGKPPFVADNFIDIVVKQVSEDPEPPRAHNSNVSLALEQVCMRALRKRPEERYATAREMRAALRYAVGMSDHPTTALLVPELRAPVPGTDTQPAFSSRVPSSRRARGDVPTLQFAEPRRTPAPGASSKAFRYVLAATLVALAGLAVVVGKDELKPSPDPRPARDGVAIFENPVAAATALAPKAPEESATPMVERTDEKPLAAGPHARRSRPHAAGAHDALRLLAATAEPGSSSAALPEPPAASAPLPPPRESATAPAAPPAPVAVESAPLPSNPPKAQPPPLDPSRGNVTWRVATVGGGATAGGVARALARSASSWTECYRAGLRTRSARVEGSATLRIACDDQGRVVEA